MAWTRLELERMPRAELLRAAAAVGLRPRGQASTILVAEILMRQGEELARRGAGPLVWRVHRLEDGQRRTEQLLVELLGVVVEVAAKVVKSPRSALKDSLERLGEVARRGGWRRGKQRKRN